MGVSLEQYRFAIGTYSRKGHRKRTRKKTHTNSDDNHSDIQHFVKPKDKINCELGFYSVTLFLLAVLIILSFDVELNPGPKHEYVRCIEGSFHQGSSCFSESSRGRQCVANSLVSILYTDMHHPENWQNTDIDAILQYGDSLYLTALPNAAHVYLSPTELPHHIEMMDHQYHITLHESIFGLMHMNPENTPGLDFKTALKTGLNCHGAILIMSQTAIGIMQRKNNYYIFDPHSRNSKGNVCADGKSILLKFNSFDHFFAFLSSANADNVQFEITPITFSQHAAILRESENNCVHCVMAETTPPRARLMPSARKRQYPHLDIEESEIGHIAKRKCTNNIVERHAHVSCISSLNSEGNIPEDIERRDTDQTKCNVPRKKKSVIPTIEFSYEQDIINEPMMIHLASFLFATEKDFIEWDENDLLKIACASRSLTNLELHQSPVDVVIQAFDCYIHIETKSGYTVNNMMPLDTQLSLALQMTYVLIETNNTSYLAMKTKTGKFVFGRINYDEDRRTKYEYSCCKTFFELCDMVKGYTLNKNIMCMLYPVFLRHIAAKRYRTLQRKQGYELKCFPKFDNKKVFGNIPEKVLKDFDNALTFSCEYICTVCEQMWFKESMHNVERLSKLNKKMFAKVDVHIASFDGNRYICTTCLHSINQNKIPNLCARNGMIFTKLPKELETLTELEERLVASRLPFMQIRGAGPMNQYKIHGNVINVEANVEKTITKLPRNVNESFVVPVQLKRKLSYKHSYIYQNVRPAVVWKAAEYLVKHSELQENLELKTNWCSEFAETIGQNTPVKSNEENTERNDLLRNESSDEDTEDLLNNNPRCVTGNNDTLLAPTYFEYDHNKLVMCAPGEGEKPLGFFKDVDSEYLAFPKIYAGKRRPDNTQRTTNVSYSAICKWELRNRDRRCAKNIANIFFKFRKLQVKHVLDKSVIAIRRTTNTNLMAGSLKTPDQIKEICALDEGYKIFRTLKTSPAYWEHVKKDMFAMIRQKGFPSFFMTFSSADMQWWDLQSALARINLNENWSKSDVMKQPWGKRAELLKCDPVTAVRHYHRRRRLFQHKIIEGPAKPIGVVIDYMYRFEAQQRGSLHDHGLYYVKNCPIYGKESDDEICKFIDRYVTCRRHHEFIAVQIHKCAKKTCYKRPSQECRFNFPRFPMPKTVILQPIKNAEYTKEQLSQIKSNYRKVKIALKSLNDTEIDTNTSANDFIKSQCLSYEEYLTTLRYSVDAPTVFLRRNISDIYVNNYNPILLSAWRANMDIQYCLDPYSIVQYIVKYVCKGQRGISNLMEKALQRSKEEGQPIERQIRNMGNVWTNKTEIPVQECIAYLLNLPFRRISTSVIFVNSSPSDKRTGLLKPREAILKMENDDDDVFSDNMIKRYARRPESLSSWCLAQFATCLTRSYTYTYRSTGDDGLLKETVDDTEDEGDVDSSTDKDTRQEEKPREYFIDKYKYKECKRKILRYIKYSKEKDPDNYYREQFFLFFPWRNELDDYLKYGSTHEIAYSSVSDTIAKNYKNYHSVDDIEKLSNQIEKDLNEIDTEIDNMSDADSSDDESQEKYVCFDPGTALSNVSDMNIEQGYATSSSKELNIKGAIPTDKYHDLIRSLNKEQKLYFDHILRWFTTKSDPLYNFVTSGAGFGKSYLLKAIYQGLIRLLSQQSLGEDLSTTTALLVAFTGKASFNIAGNTIHSTFGIPVSQNLRNYKPLSSSVLNTYQANYNRVKVLIIDEISMVSNALLRYIDLRLRDIKSSNKVFGGVSVICFGDLYQLPPTHYGYVFTDIDRFEDVDSLDDTNVWQTYFKMYQLTEMMRQKEDADFAKLLNRLRVGSHTVDDIRVLKRRTVLSTRENNLNYMPHLFYSNKSINEHNSKIFDRIETQKCISKAYDTVCGTASKHLRKLLKMKASNLESRQTGSLVLYLELAEGLRYDLTMNISCIDGLANGTTGLLKHVDVRGENQSRPSILWFDFDSEVIGKLQRQKYAHLYACGINKTWTPIFESSVEFQVEKYMSNKILRRQFPIRSSSAKSIHRSQGETLVNYVIDLTTNRKIAALHYVGLSRATSLNSLHILNLDEQHIFVDSRINDEMIRLRNCIETTCLPFTPSTNLQYYTSVIFHNVQSLHKYFREIKHDKNVLASDVFIAAQTRLKRTDLDNDYNIPGFVLHRFDCVSNENRSPYGMAVYIKDGLKISDCKTKCDNVGNQVCHFVLHNPYNIHIFSVYRSPSSSINKLFKLLSVMNVKQPNTPVIVIGDFNINAMDKDSFVFKHLTTFMSNLYLSNTYTTTYRNTLIDHVWTNLRQDVYIVNNLESYFSDHKALFFSLLSNQAILC